ncbi:MAG TPA: FAD-binding oxidoreductase [Deltaproteobacteria bacterium]|nr:FAD-binding oxidoreductase [Deltaproteobacteria bacterium]
MKRWNGWGDPSVTMDLPEQGESLLKDSLGEGTPQIDYERGKFLERMPKSRLPQHPLIMTDPEARLDHAHGQSLPDWIGLRTGMLNRFPDGVAFPSNAGEVRSLVDLAEKQKISLIPYGGGTSVLGHLTVPEEKQPVLSLSLKRLNRIVDLDEKSLLATFEAGIMGPDLEAHLQARGFTLGHYPQSFEYSSLGGWIATRSSGQYSTRYGRIDQQFQGGTVIAPRGELVMRPYPASAAGPDLRHLVLGSEGRLGVITEATMKISPLASGEEDHIFGLFFPSWEQGVEGVRNLFAAGIPLLTVRLSNARETSINLVFSGHERATAFLKRYLPLRGVPADEGCMCLLGFRGPHRLVSAARKEVGTILKEKNAVPLGKAMGEAWKKHRFLMPYLRNTLWNMGYAVETVETAVTWNRVVQTVDAMERAMAESLADMGEPTLTFSHLSSPYPTGTNLYTTALFRIASDPEETLERWKRFKEAVSSAIVTCGGTISHQHGVGIDHKPWITAEKGRAGMDVLAAACASLDPGGRMNPGKLL